MRLVEENMSSSPSTVDADLQELSICQQPKEPVGFLDLPAELQNRIYRDILVSKTPILVRLPPPNIVGTKPTSRTVYFALQPGK